MTNLQFSLVCLCALVGGFSGSVALQANSMTAQAQLRTGGQGITRSIPQQTEELIVPPNGLRIYTNDRRLLGGFALTPSGVSLTLLSANGQPGVVLTPGLAGNVAIGAGPDSVGILISDPKGGSARLSAGNQPPKLELLTSGRSTSLTGGTDPSLAIGGKSNKPVVELKTNVEGGQLLIQTNSGAKLAELFATNSGGQLNLKSNDGKTDSTSDATSFVTKKEGTVTWRSGSAGN